MAAEQRARKKDGSTGRRSFFALAPYPERRTLPRPIQAAIMPLVGTSMRGAFDRSGPETQEETMTDPSVCKGSVRGRAVGVHLLVVGLSFGLSFAILPHIVPFDPEGAAIIAAVFGVLLGHAVALVVGLLIPKTSLTSCAVVFCIAFFFTGCFGVEAIQKWTYLRYQAPYDRFRDHLASPVPDSVSNLRFVPMEEQISPELMFRFDIAPKDLDSILKRLKMKRVDPNKMLNPKDFFQYPYYLPLDGTCHVFQGKDQNEDVLTIKTNESHIHAIFRHESEGTYRDREWENPPEIQTQMDNEAMMRLKAKYEAARRSNPDSR
jgi:hypothetical protein